MKYYLVKSDRITNRDFIFEEGKALFRTYISSTGREKLEALSTVDYEWYVQSPVPSWGLGKCKELPEEEALDNILKAKVLKELVS